MKKIFTIIAAVAVTASAFAQRGQGLQIGAGYEINFYSYTPSGDWTPSSADGYHVTVAYPFALSESNAISVGLRWSQTFNFMETNILGVKERHDQTRGFISLPVKFEQHFGGFFFNVGPTLSYWAMGKDKYSVNGAAVETYSFLDKEHGGEGLNRFDIAAGAALGYDFRHIRIAAAYDYGFLKGIQEKYTPEVNYTRQSARISVAYIF